MDGIYRLDAWEARAQNVAIARRLDMRVFITGASGFIGGHVAEALARDHEVLALSRSAHGAESVRERGATPVMGNLGAVTVKDLEGVDAIVHCAAFVSEWGTREEFWAANVAGTRQLIEVAQRAGVKRFVHVSTEAVLFAGQDLIDVDETHPYPERQRFLYSETKAEAERLVLAANGPDFTTTAVRPRFVWGPRDQTVLPTILRMAQDGRFVWIDGGRSRTSTTHVANLVHGVKLALAHDKGGQAYFVADDGERTIREFLSRLAATRGVTLPTRSIPGKVARAVATVAEGAWRLLRLGGQPPLTRFTAAMLSSNVTVRTDKARAELGYEPVISVDQGIAELSAEFERAGQAAQAAPSAPSAPVPQPPVHARAADAVAM
jgi:nucleoside-diphosphate-sugar epimerase